MILRDHVYGQVSVNDKVILKLLKTKVFLRLKKIAQFGVPDKYFYMKGFSRYEHSVGVMILLKKLGASKEEQIAGLMHDVSHTAFSHIVDWVIGDSRSEEFQDQRHIDFIKDPEISKILKFDGINPKRIFNLDFFKLLDTHIPDLCADRLDYSLREMPKKISKKCVEGLTVFDNKIVFKNSETASFFANNFLDLQTNHWGGFEGAVRWHIFAGVLKRAIELKIINFEDFYKDDDYILDKIEKSEDKSIQNGLKLLLKKSLANLPKGKTLEHKKFRYVNPEFIKNGALIRLSAVDKVFSNRLKKAKAENDKGIALPAYSPL